MTASAPFAPSSWREEDRGSRAGCAGSIGSPEQCLAWGLDIELASKLPLSLGLLDLTGGGDVDLPAVVVDELALGLTGHLVVGPGDLGGAVTVVVLERARGLLDLEAAAWGAGGAFVPNALDLLVEGGILREQK